MDTIKKIEEEMANIILHPLYAEIKQEFDRLLGIMGNVDGDEIISLVILACFNKTKVKCPRPKKSFN